jgi:hypothetical protein
MVRNWDSGEVSFFSSGGGQAGVVGLGGSVFSGPVWGLNAGNNNYKNGSTTLSASGELFGGAASFNSPGIEHPISSLNPANWSAPASATFNIGLNIVPVSGGIAVTHYSQPKGTTNLPPASFEDRLGALLRLPCH